MATSGDARRSRTSIAFRCTAWLSCLLTLSAARGATAPTALTGSLETVRGVRVLKVWGGPYERGFAHGHLLGRDIMSLMRSALLHPQIFADARAYETRILNGLLKKMRFSAEQQKELEGMLAGMTASLSRDELWLEPLKRGIGHSDLLALNAAADWYRLACSSFSAWGPLAAGGEMITARNLDFLTLPGTKELQLLMVMLEPGEGRKRWVSVTWPGMIGAYTAINEEGVTVSLHDAPGLPGAPGGPIVPRSLALRGIVEQTADESAVDDAVRILRASPALVGNNIHVSAPFRGQPLPAAILEYDGDAGVDGGVTLRVPGEAASTELENAVYCTNHYRKRAAPESCQRFDTIEKALSELAAAGHTVDVEAARRIMRAVAVEGTLHSVVFLPNRLEFHVGVATQDRCGADVAPRHFRLGDLFTGP